MKNLFFIFTIAAMLFSCAGKTTKESGSRGVASTDDDNESKLYNRVKIRFKEEMYIGTNDKFDELTTISKSVTIVDHDGRYAYCKINAINVPAESDAYFKKGRELTLVLPTRSDGGQYNLYNESKGYVANFYCQNSNNFFIKMNKYDVQKLLNAEVLSKQFKRYDIKYDSDDAIEETEAQEI